MEYFNVKRTIWLKGYQNGKTTAARNKQKIRIDPARGCRSGSP